MAMTALDRIPDGHPRTCDDCSRAFKGEAWMDFCAECHAKREETSPLKSRWACLTCNTTFPLGSVRSGPQGWQCPKCKSSDLSTAEGSRELPAYHGEIGTKN